MMRFAETFDLVLKDKKTQTTRRPAEQWYDWYKDVNEHARPVFAEGSEGRNCAILLTACFKTKLNEVATHPAHFEREGFSTGQEFKDVWTKLYGSFDPQLEVCVIRFSKLPADPITSGEAKKNG